MKEIPETMILQMMGRAGRQQYNTSGRVYIMTKQEYVVSETKFSFFFFKSHRLHK